MSYSKFNNRGRPLLFATALLAGLFSPAFVNAGNSDNYLARVDALQFQAQQLSQSLNTLSGVSAFDGLTPPADIGGTQFQVAQSRDIGALAVRLAQIEEQMRILTGQVEGLQFQMTQFNVLLERTQEDNDFRFLQLEEALGKTDAASLSGGATPTAELPQSNINSLGGTNISPTQPNGGLTPQEFEQNLDIAILSQGALSGPALSGLDLNAPIGGVLGQGQALDLEFDPGQIVSSDDADAQYRAGYEAVVKGDYAFAETQFRQFVALFPTHPQAPDATNWLGEALLQRAEYDEAAEVLFNGFRAYENSVRAPDLLLKLGMALSGAGERDTACRTFREVQQRYPEMGAAFLSRVIQESIQAQC